MDQDIKEYIEGNISLIENNEWAEFYKDIWPALLGKEVSELTRIFKNCGIDPLEYLPYIPKYYYFLNPLKLETYQAPEGIIEINSGSFENCKGLRKIRFPYSLEAIWPDAFLECRQLEEVIIPDTVKNIFNSSFRDCNNISRITVLGDYRKLIIDWNEIFLKSKSNYLKIIDTSGNQMVFR